MTDEAKSYYDVGKEFAGHDTVNHGREEYVRYTGDADYVITPTRSKASIRSSNAA